jgi:hypothetical protein
MKNVAAARFVAIVSCCAYWSAPAAANEINLSSLTCKQFQSVNKDDVGIILAWLDGYYRAEDDPPIIDTGHSPPMPRSSATIARCIRIRR